jgi:hypothetical protein
MLFKRNSCIALVVLTASFSAVEKPAQAEGAKTVMPVSASWGSEQSMMHSHSDDSRRQLALAPCKLPKAETSADVASAKQMAELTDAVTVTARRVSKEGSKQFAQLTRWFALLWKQQTTPPTMTPSAGPALSTQNDSIRSYRGQPMRSVTAKHPLWLLTDGRMKTVTAQ